MQIVLPLLALLLGLGAWRAWRRSPVYSLRTNLQLAAAFLLMVAAVIGVTLGISSSPANRSQTATAALTIVAILLVFAGFITVVFRITEGRLAHLPKGAGLCHIHRRRLFPWLGRMAVSLLLFSAAAFFAPPNWAALPLTLGGLVLLLGTAVLFPLYLKARRFDRGMASLLAGPWVHWRYTPEQWQSWAAIQRSWERARTPVFRWNRDWSKLMAPILILAAIPWCLGDGSPSQEIAIFLACLLVLLLSATLLTWAVRREPERRYRRMLTARREAYMGTDGLYCGGEYSPWILSGSYLVEAAAVHDPPARLVLTFDCFAGSGTAHVARVIPIPDGCERDLDTLQQQLRVYCPKAAIHLTAPAWPLI